MGGENSSDVVRATGLRKELVSREKVQIHKGFIIGACSDRQREDSVHVQRCALLGACIETTHAGTRAHLSLSLR